jgi:UDP-N-acetylmuramoyl-tripeptide--D-alanyl-D-alanine ligase
MIPLTLDEIRVLQAGELVAAEGAERVSGIVIDSRTAGPGDLFVPVGRGREFVGEAAARGASVLVPEDAFAALAALAAAVRARSGARVAAITGSTGKTSTKDVLAALCRPHARTVAAAGGNNNEVGVPLTLFRVEPDTELVVVEMGMRGLGQIAALCSVARPHVGVVTSVGPVHLELLGTVERVAQAKAEVVASLPPGGTAVVPAEAPALEPFLGREDVELVRVGPGGDVRLERFEPPLLVADVAGTRVELRVPFTARHQAQNTLAALSAYRALGLPLERAHEGADSIAFGRWRGEERELADGVLLIDDCYNANPPSMRAALAHLVQRAAGRRTVALLGDMAELGPEAPAYHRDVGRWAAAAGIGALVAVGPLARGYAEAATDAGVRVVRWAPTREEALAELEDVLEHGDVLLVKGSRAMGLEAIGEALRPRVGVR